MRSKAYADLLGIVAMLAGVATMTVSSIRWVDFLGGAAVICGLGAAAWAASLFKAYIGVLLITALIVALLLIFDYGDLITRTVGAFAGTAECKAGR
jgi:hypothetical protein